MSHTNLVENYLLWLKENIKSKDIENGYHFTLPFLDNHNDHIEIYAIKTSESEITLTDGGYIINDLEMSGVSFNSPARKNILDQTLLSYGVKLDENDNSIYIKTDLQNLPKKKHSLVQCILAVSDLYVLARESIQNFFFDDVMAKFKEKSVPVIPKFIINGKSGYPNTIDIAIPTKFGEILIKTISNPKKDRITSALFSYNDIRQTGREIKEGIIIYDDREFELKKDDEIAAKNYQTKFLPYQSIANYIDSGILVS
ncbi:DUF1828 domain-containing protein [Flavobacterium sp.]|jgi:hypothetical protein|uniref:DUF1828 domain-containing protein n=1 Tax=Flavobacterium sp. TaxID=239 RepID=UPI0037C12288